MACDVRLRALSYACLWRRVQTLSAKDFIYSSRVKLHLCCLLPGEATVLHPLRSWHTADIPISCSPALLQFVSACLAEDALTDQKVCPHHLLGSGAPMVQTLAGSPGANNDKKLIRCCNFLSLSLSLIQYAFRKSLRC